MHQFGHPCDHGEVCSRNCRCRYGVNHAPLEDQVHIHQAVTNDGVTERQGQQPQRQHRHLHRGSGQRPGQERNYIKQGEGCNRQNGAAGDPFKLLPQYGSTRPTIAIQQHAGGNHEVQCEIPDFKAL